MATHHKTTPNSEKKLLLQNLPGIDRIIESALTDPALAAIPKSVLTDAARRAVDFFRRQIIDSKPDETIVHISEARVLRHVANLVKEAMQLNLRKVINATGVVVHTNLGRSLLSETTIRHVQSVACDYSNLEFDLVAGKRGSRYSAVEDLICEISGAESGMVVNNNAAAVLLCLDTIAHQKEVIVSRGELVEIGGSFRIPDVMAKSGAILKEVGTTNRTHVSDYQRAINEHTGLLLKVHTSNYSIIGFTASVSLAEMVSLGNRYQIPVMEDLGSGTFIDFSRYGLQKEPTIGESVSAGVDVVTFSGDKLLGGPQAGIIAGTKLIVDKIKKNPLTRALRIDKMTLAALESTLRLYRDERKALTEIPTLKMITDDMQEAEKKAETLLALLLSANETRLAVKVVDSISRAGGGSLPLLEIPSRSIRVNIKGASPNELENHMRQNDPPIIGRIEEDAYLLDMRTVFQEDLSDISTAVIAFLKGT